VKTVTITHKQQTVYEYIQHYYSEYRCSPLIREIQLGCQIISYKSALDRLNALERKGLIKRLPNKHRGIKLVRKAVEPRLKVHAPTLETVGEGATV
jgi:repressor LexA